MPLGRLALSGGGEWEMGLVSSIFAVTVAATVDVAFSVQLLLCLVMVDGGCG